MPSGWALHWLLHQLYVVIAMDGAPALIALVAIVLIASIEFYDWLYHIGACIEDRRMCEYTIVIQAALTCFIMMIY